MQSTQLLTSTSWLSAVSGWKPPPMPASPPLDTTTQNRSRSLHLTTEVRLSPSRKFNAHHGVSVAHGSDVPYVYGDPADQSPASIFLSDVIIDYWVSFATSLTPNDGHGVVPRASPASYLALSLTSCRFTQGPNGPSSHPRIRFVLVLYFARLCSSPSAGRHATQRHELDHDPRRLPPRYAIIVNFPRCADYKN